MLTFRFYSHKTERVETISMEPVPAGWILDHPCHSGRTNPDGRPYLFECIQEHFTSHPPAFWDALEELWSASRTKVLSEQELQTCLDQLSEWLNHYDRTRNPSLALYRT